MRKRYRLKHLENPTSTTRKYAMHGNGFFSNLMKRLGKNVKKHAAPVLLGAAKELAPQVLSYGANKVLEKASNKGVPDSIVNLGSKATQAGLKRLQDSKGPKQTDQQKMVADLISKNSAKLLGNILAKGSGVRGIGSGVRGIGSGVRGIGSGVRGIGSGVVLSETPRF